jgi:hypothetical protein
MTSTLAQPQTPPAYVEMFGLLTGMFIGGAVATLAQLGVPDLLEDGPKSAEELAPQIKANPDALYRLMRATASVGVLRESPDRKFLKLS